MTPPLIAIMAPSFSLLLMVTAHMIFHGRSARTISINPEYAAKSRPRQHIRSGLPMGRWLTSNKCVIVLHEIWRETGAIQIPVPKFPNGPALHPLNRPVGTQYEIDRDNNEPDEQPHTAGGDTQQGNCKGSFTPASGKNGGKPS